MYFSNPKAKTVKCLRAPVTELDLDHILDVLNAFAFTGRHPVSKSDRKEFEESILNSFDKSIPKNVKAVLSSMTEKEKESLFR